MNTNLYLHALNAGTRVDSFGSTVKDRKEILDEFVKNILVEAIPPVTISALELGIKQKETK